MNYAEGGTRPLSLLLSLSLWMVGAGAISYVIDIERLWAVNASAFWVWVRFFSLSGRESEGARASQDFPASSRLIEAPSRPCRFRRQRHQDRLDIAAGLQAECGAAVVEQVELDIAAAAHELVASLLRRPGLPHPVPHDGREDGEEGVPDRSDKGEVAFPVAAVQVIEEDPARPARFAAVLQKEVLVAPLLEAGIAVGAVGRAGAGESRMKLTDRHRIGVDRGDVGAAAEPRLRRHDVTSVHMYRWNQRRAHMSDERDAARPEPRVVLGPGNGVAELGRKFAVDGRNVDPDFFEDPPAHDRDRPAAPARPLPFGALEAAGRSLGRALAGEFILDRLEGRADSVAQSGKPCLGRGATGWIEEKGGGFGHRSGNSWVWRSASASAMAPARATLSDRAGRRKGMTTRAAAHS